jgi:hypothetical protein
MKKCCFAVSVALLAMQLFAQTPRPRLFVLTDLANEPDDEESLVRLLVYANEFDIEGLVATTSIHMKNGPRVDILRATIGAYGEVRGNLAVHATGYPTSEALLAVSASGQPGYGLSSVDKPTPGSKLLAERILVKDARPLWITVWGGANTLLRALRDARSSATHDAFSRALKNLRVYSICDQDDTGYVIRCEFPELCYIVDPCPPGRPGDGRSYDNSTWRGISGDLHGRGKLHYPFREMVENRWLEENIISKGPLGRRYPKWKYFMEGDTPAYLGLIGNGLGWIESPSYGGWGGRYEWRRPAAEPHEIWASPIECDDYDGKKRPMSAIIRWREEYQSDFAGRMLWSVTPKYADANHNPVAVLNGDRTKDVVRIKARRGESVRLTAAGTSDPDGDKLRYEWFIYREAGTLRGGSLSAGGAGATVSLSDVAPDDSGELHVVLRVRDDGMPAMFAYRRAVIAVGE